MKQLLLSFLMISPFLNAQEHHSSFSQDDCDLFRLYADSDYADDDYTSSDKESSESSELSTNSSESQEYDWQTIQTLSVAQCKEYGADKVKKAAFKALKTCNPHEVKTITDGLLDMLRTMSPDTSDDESESYTSDYSSDNESDVAYLLAKSRGGRKRFAQTHYEQNTHAEKKALTRKEKRKAYRKKAAKAAYAKLKTDQQIVASKAEINETVSSRNQESTTPVAIPAVCRKWMVAEYTPEDPAHPYFFELLHQLDNGLISEGELLLEANGYRSDYVSNDNDDVEDWITIIREWDNDKRRAYGEEYLVESAMKRLNENPQNGYSIIMGLCVMLDNIAQPETPMPIAQGADTSSDDSDDKLDQAITRGQFFETFKKAVAASGPYAARLDLYDLFENFEEHRNFLRFKTPDLRDNPIGYVPFHYSTSLKELERYLPHATWQMVEAALHEARPIMERADTPFEQYLALIAFSISDSVQLAQLEAAAAEDDYCASISADHDDAYALSKSRGARNRLAKTEHKRHENAEKKSLVHKERKVKKSAYAHLKKAQLVDLKEHVLKPSEYNSLRAEMAPDDQKAQTVQPAASTSAAPSDSEDDSDKSTSSWEVCSDYQDCENPACTYKMARVCCKCEYGMRLRQSHAEITECTQAFNALSLDHNDDSDSDNPIADNTKKQFGIPAEQNPRLFDLLELYQEDLIDEQALYNGLFGDENPQTKTIYHRDGNDNDDDDKNSDMSLGYSDSTDSNARTAERMREKAYLDRVDEENRQAAERMREKAHIDEVTDEWTRGLELLLTRHNNN